MPTRSEAALSALTIPGPVDREDFSHAQRRHRRARRRYSAASGVAMLMMGIPLAAVITPLLFLAALLVPGLAVHLVAWVGVRRLFGAAGSGAALTLGARDPRPGELEEHQLVNVVEEMAIACGVKAPSIQLLDTEVANAAVIGSDVEDATLVVTTGLLAALSRDETQAVLAHAI